jgi:pimeloyl-ACP methyl ester carboxylesterase
MTPAGSPGRIETLNGIPVYYEVHGTGEPVLLLHGFTGSSQDWAAVVAAWSRNFRLIVPDLRGHGRSAVLDRTFRHDEAAADVLALLDRLEAGAVRAIGVSGGGNILLHLATKHPERVKAMVLVSATPYFPPQARAIMRRYPDTLSDEQLTLLRGRHAGGEGQVQALMAAARAFADSYDDLNFTPPLLSTIQARTLIVQGDRDPLYPVELSVEMARAIPLSSLWIIPNAGHGPVIGERWAEFLKIAAAFLA